jgi:hypothetical protein
LPSPSLTLGARAANPAGTARTRAITHACRPSAAVGHRAGNPAHVAVPPPIRLAITTVSEWTLESEKPRKNPQNPFS